MLAYLQLQSTDQGVVNGPTKSRDNQPTHTKKKKKKKKNRLRYRDHCSADGLEGSTGRIPGKKEKRKHVRLAPGSHLSGDDGLAWTIDD